VTQRRDTGPVPRIGARRPVRARRRRLGRPAARLRVSIAVVLGLMLLVSGRLLQLQGLDATAYAARAQQQRAHDTVIPASRGSIVDRNGRAFAQDVDARLVYVDPTEVTDIASVAGGLASALGMDVQKVAASIEGAPAGSRYVVIAHDVPVSTGDQISALKLSGVVVQREVRRDHPGGALAAQVVGVTGTDDQGLSGIELTMDKVLAGTPGKVEEQVDPQGRVIPQAGTEETPAIDGQRVRLTLDRDLQWEAQSALLAQVQATGARGGHIVVLNPRSGEILALASVPGFDASKPIDPAKLRLGAVQDVYEPGSVNKVITAAAALQEGVMSPTTEVTVPPVGHWPGRPSVITDAENHGTEHLTFTGVLAQSSNIGTDEVAQMVGMPTIYKYLSLFGLGSSTGSGLPGESAGVIPPLAGLNPSAASTIPFGQGMSVTALQVAMAYATIANGGLRPAPRIVSGTTAADGTFRPAHYAAPVRVVSTQTARTLARMLEAVTGETGTAPEAAIPGYRIAGKTGTAQAIGANGRYDGGYVASFVGFAPAEAPKLLVEVVLDHPQGAHFGGVIAAPVFKTVMSFALRELGITPTGTPSPRWTLSFDK
jgi:cell division protein FtsI (penicillin-binding protein 3)